MGLYFPEQLGMENSFSLVLTLGSVSHRAMGPAAVAPSGSHRIRAALPAPALLENHCPVLASLNRYIK